MTSIIRCTTTADITATGIKNRYHHAKLPLTDNTGCVISTEQEWHAARAKQSNWETILQILSLRTLLGTVTVPEFNGQNWQFTAELETPSAVATEDNPIGLLLQDSAGVPVSTARGIELLNPYMPSPNIWFALTGI